MEWYAYSQIHCEYARDVNKKRPCDIVATVEEKKTKKQQQMIEKWTSYNCNEKCMRK